MIAKWQKTKSFVIPDDDEFNERLFVVARPNSKHIKDTKYQS
jgi:hypothetical protein